MKRILLPATGAILATGLLAAGLAGSAQAEPEYDATVLAKRAEDVAAIIDFWTKSNNQALKSAEAYHYDYKDIKKIVSKGGYSPDSKPGNTTFPGDVKTTSKVHNVNLPKTIGKVFFETHDGKLAWCSGTSIQSNYKNLVATAGHCVYDLAANKEVVSRWVFVPGYYQGKTPWGIYVGKTAYTHYDFDVYEDFDRDYAFVTVYNGLNVKGSGGEKKQVLKSEFDAYKGQKWVEKKTITAAEYTAGVDKYGDNGPFKKESVTSAPETVAKPASVTTGAEALKYYTATGIGGIKLTATEVTEGTYAAAPDGLDNNAKFVGPTTTSVLPISLEEFNKLQIEKGDGKFLGKLWAVDKEGKITSDASKAVGWWKQQYFIKKWVKSTTSEVYWVETYFIGTAYDIALTDAGTLGGNVGGQGFAWNQPTGKYVRVFGYPSATHPDGHKAYTGVTPKWCYGKTGAKATVNAAKKVEEHVALKCAMTAGANGGPWLLKYSNAKRLGYVNGVTSLFWDNDGNDRVDYISSPYFDGETAAVYDAAKNSWSGLILPKK